MITEDGLGVAAEVAAALEKEGANVTILPSVTLQSQEKLNQAIANLRQTQGAITGIIHLAPLAELPMPETLVDWREYTQAHAKSLFEILKIVAQDWQGSLSQPPPQDVKSKFVLSASLLGGYLGREGDGNLGLATGGASNGLLKTLIREWSGVQAKSIDFDRNLSPSAIAQHIVQELLIPGGSSEVGYPLGKRTIFETIPASLTVREKPTTEQPTSDWVMLITGGARGITAEITKTLMIPGMTLIIVGRSPEPREEPPTTQGIEDITRLRQIWLEQARSQGQSPTPVQIENDLQALMRDRAIRSNLAWFRQQGTVEYWSVDVRNPEAFGLLIEQIYTRYGRLDAVIHGAGIIEDKLILDKRTDSFARVFDTKVDSAFILSRYLHPDSLKWLVLFGSVAGRYGNRGQSDYGAANEVVNRLAWQLNQQWSSTRVVAINWGPWDTTGMASESVKRKFREAGIVPISLAAGCQFLVEELSYGFKGDVEIIAGEGPWSTWEAAQATFEHQTPDPLNPLVLLVQKPQLQPNGAVILEHTFSLTNDPYLHDHRLDGNPVLPATGAVEWFAQVVQSAWPEWVVAEVRDLRVLRGLVLHQEADQTVLFRARASSHADAESLQVVVELLDAEEKYPCYRASVLLESKLRESPSWKFSPLSKGTSLEPVTAYHDYLFHGSRFQLITGIERITEQGIDAEVISSSPQLWKLPVSTESTEANKHRTGDQDLPEQSSYHWLFDPGLLDTAPQLAIVWARVQYNTTVLPSRLGLVIRYAPLLPNSPLQVAFRVKDYNHHSLLYDAVFFNRKGQVCLQVQDVESTGNPALNRLGTAPR